MSKEVFGIVGQQTGEKYGSICVPDATDYETAYLIDSLFNLILDSDNNPLSETLDVVILA